MLTPLAVAVWGAALASLLPGRGVAQRVGADSLIYRLAATSELTVTTGKAGLFGFAGHDHVIRARAFSGRVAYYPGSPSASHVEMVAATDSLEVLTPPDTAEIRQVTEAMRRQVLHTDRYPDIRFASTTVVQTPAGFRVEGALTLAGTTRPVLLEVAVVTKGDTLWAKTRFTVKQREFGIRPYRGGPAGTVQVADRVTFDIAAVAIAEPKPSGPP